MKLVADVFYLVLFSAIGNGLFYLASEGLMAPEHRSACRIGFLIVWSLYLAFLQIRLNRELRKMSI